MGHTDASAEGDLALGLDSVELGQDAASVRGEGGQHFTVTGTWSSGQESASKLCLNHLFFRDLDNNCNL